MEVTAEDCERALCTIRNTMRYILQFYKFCKEKNTFPTHVIEHNRGSEFPVPDNIKLEAKTLICQLCGTFPLEHYKNFVENDNLQPVFGDLRHRLGQLKTDFDIIQWICVCCIIAVKLFEIGYADFPNMMSKFIYDSCMIFAKEQTIRALEGRVLEDADN